MSFKKPLLALAVLSAALFSAHSAQAAAVLTLKQLTTGEVPTIQVGDKLFSNFTYSKTGDMPDAALVNVIPLIETNPDLWGISFQGAFQDLAGGGASDAVIRYKVTVLDPEFVITDAHLRGNPAVLPTGNNPASGYISVVETFFPNVGDKLISVYNFQPPGIVLNVDEILFSGKGFTTLNVQKDIQAQVTSTFGVANLSVVDQLYSQGESGGGGVPEPASLGILAIGAASLLLKRRRA